MFNILQNLLSRFETEENLSLLTKLNRGIEKEGLRIDSQGLVAQTRHPHTLGSVFTHPYITTDYSEALLEFITPVNQSIDDSIRYLIDLHIHTSRNIAAEYIWPASMPGLTHENHTSKLVTNLFR